MKEGGELAGVVIADAAPPGKEIRDIVPTGKDLRYERALRETVLLQEMGHDFCRRRAIGSF